MAKITKLQDVVDWRLCLGCGACASLCTHGAITLRDFTSEGIRPVVDEARCAGDCDCLKVCPAVQTTFPPARDTFEQEWGPVLEVWEGYAADPEVRFRGSSGGALSAITAYCIERAGMHGVLHTGQDPQDPVRNRTRLSRTYAQILSASGSRYSPASVCDGLGLVENAPAACAIIGKPAEIAAVRNAETLRPALREKVGVCLSFFCAETPATRGTLEFLKEHGVEPSTVETLRYRGFGWPGHFAPTQIGKSEPAFQRTYRESWAYLQKFRPWSTQLWPDGSGECADISCGDPWYEEPDGKNPGFSLVVVRTEKGREIVRGAIESGYLVLTSAERWKLAKSQPGLLDKKGSVWGRRVASSLAGLPTTRLVRGALFHCWKTLSLEAKVRSTLGTIRRILGRRLFSRIKLDPVASVPVGPPLAMPPPDETPSSAGHGAG
ncbi:MAG: Coenzyme F420 hydrogenase/dehydrogenase, beta subunit C-terminal domain [Opitutaceae bacterium]|nr:Coenzyme F420 hydrogenase/dehydrogenase, beta subunit C-terminal domain [Opitutaceae bacterium]